MMNPATSPSPALSRTKRRFDGGMIIMAVLTAFCGLMIGFLVSGHTGPSVTTLIAAVLASGIGWWARGLL